MNLLNKNRCICHKLLEMIHCAKGTVMLHSMCYCYLRKTVEAWNERLCPGVEDLTMRGSCLWANNNFCNCHLRTCIQWNTWNYHSSFRELDIRILMRFFTCAKFGWIKHIYKLGNSQTLTVSHWLVLWCLNLVSFRWKLPYTYINTHLFSKAAGFIEKHVFHFHTDLPRGGSDIFRKQKQTMCPLLLFQRASPSPTRPIPFRTRQVKILTHRCMIPHLIQAADTWADGSVRSLASAQSCHAWRDFIPPARELSDMINSPRWPEMPHI